VFSTASTVLEDEAWAVRTSDPYVCLEANEMLIRAQGTAKIRSGHTFRCRIYAPSMHVPIHPGICILGNKHKLVNAFGFQISKY